MIAGPTASGKSDFALQLCKKINGVIINFDSMQVYKELRILSARPNKLSMDIVDHKLQVHFLEMWLFQTAVRLQMA